MEDGRVQRVLPLGRVHAIIGGFHLTGAKPEVTVKTVAGIKAFRPDYIVPIHCAGHEAISAFAREVPDRFILSTYP
jgi:7,8-dihydropterin-6-yl-methyl-4-(beta-D-ribofuranosyl)aminobenzene 5'-phosphate synthase